MHGPLLQEKPTSLCRLGVWEAGSFSGSRPPSLPTALAGAVSFFSVPRGRARARCLARRGGVGISGRLSQRGGCVLRRAFIHSFCDTDREAVPQS